MAPRALIRNLKSSFACLITHESWHGMAWGCVKSSYRFASQDERGDAAIAIGAPPSSTLHPRRSGSLNPFSSNPCALHSLAHSSCQMQGAQWQVRGGQGSPLPARQHTSQQIKSQVEPPTPVAVALWAWPRIERLRRATCVRATRGLWSCGLTCGGPALCERVTALTTVIRSASS